jgi:hypothetical protein
MDDIATQNETDNNSQCSRIRNSRERPLLLSPETSYDNFRDQLIQSTVTKQKNSNRSMALVSCLLAIFLGIPALLLATTLDEGTGRNSGASIIPDDCTNTGDNKEANLTILLKDRRLMSLMSPSEMEELFLETYNSLSGKCSGPYKRVLTKIELVSAKYMEHPGVLTTAWSGIVNCHGCPDENALFALYSPASNANESEKGGHESEEDGKLQKSPSLVASPNNDDGIATEEEKEVKLDFERNFARRFQSQLKERLSEKQMQSEGTFLSFARRMEGILNTTDVTDKEGAVNVIEDDMFKEEEGSDFKDFALLMSETEIVVLINDTANELDQFSNGTSFVGNENGTYPEDNRTEIVVLTNDTVIELALVSNRTSFVGNENGTYLEDKDGEVVRGVSVEHNPTEQHPTPSSAPTGEPCDDRREFFWIPEPEEVPPNFGKAGRLERITESPSGSPSIPPSISPSDHPSAVPSIQPSPRQTASPSNSPSVQPSLSPSLQPSYPEPTMQGPSATPNAVPTVSMAPSVSLEPSISQMPSVTEEPTFFRVDDFSVATEQPSSVPIAVHTAAVSVSSEPTAVYTAALEMSDFPSGTPSVFPTTGEPSGRPTRKPTPLPTEASSTLPPSIVPTLTPTSGAPSLGPSDVPSIAPSLQPTISPSKTPTETPTTLAPTGTPTIKPTEAPTTTPTKAPSPVPTTATPTGTPTQAPSPVPTTLAPTGTPTKKPTDAPTTTPTQAPSPVPTTAIPTRTPTQLPTRKPTEAPTDVPTPKPTSAAPTKVPTPRPTEVPTMAPVSPAPSSKPTEAPVSPAPTNYPTPRPTGAPTSAMPTPLPSATFTQRFVATPRPTTGSPTMLPTIRPTMPPTGRPTTTNPTAAPTAYYTESFKLSPRPTPVPTMIPTIVRKQPVFLIESMEPSYSMEPTVSLAPSVSLEPSRSTMPSVSLEPSIHPDTPPPSPRPTVPPTLPPSPRPTLPPITMLLTLPPTLPPTLSPTLPPITMPPSLRPSLPPTPEPTSAHPSATPSDNPSSMPSQIPTITRAISFFTEPPITRPPVSRAGPFVVVPEHKEEPCDDRRNFFWLPLPEEASTPQRSSSFPDELEMAHKCLQSSIILDENFEKNGAEEGWEHGDVSYSKELTFFLGRLDGQYNPKVSRSFDIPPAEDGTLASNATIEFVLYTIDDWGPNDAIYVVIGSTTIDIGQLESKVQVDTYINDSIEGISWWRSVLLQGSDLGFGSSTDKKYLLEFNIPKEHFEDGSLFFEMRLETRADVETLSAGIDDFIVEAYYNCTNVRHKRNLKRDNELKADGFWSVIADARVDDPSKQDPVGDDMKPYCKAEDFPCPGGYDMVHICHYTQLHGYKTICIPEGDSDILRFYPQDYCGPCVGGFGSWIWLDN